MPLIENTRNKGIHTFAEPRFLRRKHSAGKNFAVYKRCVQSSYFLSLLTAVRIVSATVKVTLFIEVEIGRLSVIYTFVLAK